MTSRIEAKLAELGHKLPPAGQALNAYENVVIVNELAFVAGQAPMIGSERPFTGPLATEADIEKGKKATQLSALCVLAQMKAALGGDLDRIVRCVKLGVFVNSVPGFMGQPMAANGASDLMFSVMGEAGRHARFAVGTIGPMEFTCSVEAIFQVQV